MKTSSEDVQKKIDEYSQICRHPESPPLKLGLPYALLPSSDMPSTKLSGRWPNPWPDGNEGGVYLVLDDDLCLLYVGKASMKSHIGSRLSKHFREGLSGCVVAENWRTAPKYIATLPIKEAGSLRRQLLRNT